MTDAVAEQQQLEAPMAPARGPVEHSVKSWPQFFDVALSGAKVHEVRRLTDRDYRVGDRLRLQGEYARLRQLESRAQIPSRFPG
jgi:hypothetical protein